MILLPDHAYVGQPSPLCNPYVVVRDGNPEEVIAQLWAQLQSLGSLQEAKPCRVLELARSGEMKLSRWCAPLPCNAEAWLAGVGPMNRIYNTGLP